MQLRPPNGRPVRVDSQAAHHPILGCCDAFYIADEPAPRCLGTAIDWQAPSFIPALDKPGALPPGAGTAVMNAIATLAARAGRERLRYRGPYPSASLFDTLLQSFRTLDPPDVALARFTADAEAKMLDPKVEEVPVDFVPAPHVWEFVTPSLCVQRRDGIERVFVGGVPFERHRLGHRRIRPTQDGGVQLLVEVAGEVWATVGVLDPAGQPRSLEPVPPSAPPELEGLEIVPALAGILATVVASRAPRWLAEIVRTKAWPMRWADTGWDLARMRDGTVEVHARLAERLERDPNVVLGVVAQAVEPVLLRAAQAELATLTGDASASER